MGRLIGAEIRRREDPPLLRGLGRFVDDLALPRMAFVSVLRSPHAHARVRRIDPSRGLDMPLTLGSGLGGDPLHPIRQEATVNADPIVAPAP